MSSFEKIKIVLEAEQLIAQETWRMAMDRDNPMKYLGLIGAMHAVTPLVHALHVTSPEHSMAVSADQMRVARAGYFYARYIDDVLDGDHREYPQNSAKPENLPMSVAELDESNHHIAPLGRYAVKGTLRMQTEDDDARSDWQRLLNSMANDYQRRTEMRLFDTEHDMVRHYTDTQKSTNIMCIGLRSALRESDIPGYSIGLTRVYSARDMRDDWNAGLFNIPADTLKEFALNFPSNVTIDKLNFEQIERLEPYAHWQTVQLDTARTELTASIETISELPSDPASVATRMIAQKNLNRIPDLQRAVEQAVTA